MHPHSLVVLFGRALTRQFRPATPSFLPPLFCVPKENLSDNSVVILYDPVQTANGQLTMKAYRLSKAFMRVYREKKNEVIKPSEILEELPIKIRNPGIINALIFDLQVGAAAAFSGARRLWACAYVGPAVASLLTGSTADCCCCRC